MVACVCVKLMAAAEKMLPTTTHELQRLGNMHDRSSLLVLIRCHSIQRAVGTHTLLEIISVSTKEGYTPTYMLQTRRLEPVVRCLLQRPVVPVVEGICAQTRAVT